MKAFLIIFFVSYVSYGQSIDSLKLSDTIYVDLANYSSHRMNLKVTPTGNSYRDVYELKNGVEKKVSIITSKEKKDIVKVCTKEFFQNNADKIITLDFIEKIGLGEFYVDVLKNGSRKKHIFILDSSKKKKRTEIRKCTVFSSDFIIM